MVNQRPYSEDVFLQDNFRRQQSEQSIEDIIEKYKQKDIRSDYNDAVYQFIKNLTKSSLKLKKIKRQYRKTQLLQYIQKTNHWIMNNRIKSYENNDFLFYGIYIPFQQDQHDQYNSNFVVGILETDFSVFSTQKRAPFKIVLECIDFQELMKKSSKEKLDILNYSKSQMENIVTSLEEFEQISDQSQDEINIKDYNEEKYKEFVVFAKEFQPSKVEDQNLENQKKMKYILEQQEKFNKMFPLKDLHRRNSFEQENLLKRKEHKRVKSLENPENLTLQQTLHKIQKIQKVIGNMRQNSILNKFYKQVESHMQKSQQKIEAQGPFEESWNIKQKEIRQKQFFGSFESYKLRPIIVKGGDDLRQEVLAMQLIKKFQLIFEKSGQKLYIRPYEIMVCSPSSGFLSFLVNTLSIDSLKKKMPRKTLAQIYKEIFITNFDEARSNFIESLAGYSLLCYFLQIKDRHNGNILIDNQGYLLHIDFGFFLSISPGGINFESAPFKLTSEYLELMGGVNSDHFRYFKILIYKGFMEIRANFEQIYLLLSIFLKCSDFPCFEAFNFKEFKDRFYLDKENLFEVSEKLVELSLDNWKTKQYDRFQKLRNGIN